MFGVAPAFVANGLMRIKPIITPYDLADQIFDSSNLLKLIQSQMEDSEKQLRYEVSKALFQPLIRFRSVYDDIKYPQDKYNRWHNVYATIKVAD